LAVSFQPIILAKERWRRRYALLQDAALVGKVRSNGRIDDPMHLNNG
jgi:hypothetical protein